jgi:hypothetical protein
MVGYFTVSPTLGGSFVDWDWIYSRHAYERTEHAIHIRLERPVVVMMNGHINKGVILKPEQQGGQSKQGSGTA